MLRDGRSHARLKPDPISASSCRPIIRLDKTVRSNTLEGLWLRCDNIEIDDLHCLIGFTLFFSLPPFFLILLLPNFFFFVIFSYFTLSSFDLIVIWKVIGFYRGSLYTCIHVWICIWFEKSTFCNVVWLIVLNLVGRCIHFHFVCSFKWSDKKIISKIDDSGIIIYLNGYFKGFVNTSGGVGVDIKIEKLVNRK